jgi:long-chain acyl-CoA synthetase
MLGYWNHPAASALAVDSDGWLHTGDQAAVDEGRHLFITGRLKEVIVLSNGEKVPPADMEMAIGMDPLISQVLVIGEARPFLAALVVLDADAYAGLAASSELPPGLADALRNSRLEEILLERIGTRLRGFPGYAKINRVGVVERPWSIEDGTMTPTMKLKRARILAQYKEEVARLYEGHV